MRAIDVVASNPPLAAPSSEGVVSPRGDAVWHELDRLSASHAYWLISRGVQRSETSPDLIRSAEASFDGLGGFEFGAPGTHTLILKAEDRGEVVDLVAWEPDTGALAAWYGRAFCLGDADDIFNPATYFAGGALRVHRTPLEWLLAGRNGIVIVRPEFTRAYLASCRRLIVSGTSYARRIQQLLLPPKPTVEIFVVAGDTVDERVSI